MPHVPGGDREDCQSCRPRAPRRLAKAWSCTTESEKVVQARKSHARTAARQPSARLSGLRRRRRVRTAGHDVQVRRVGVEVHRHQEPPRRAAVVSGGVLRPPALHSVLPLRPGLRRRHGRVGAGHPESRPEFGHRSQQRRPSRLRRMRYVHRHLSGRRTHQRRLPLQDTPLGDEPRRHRLHALRRWLPHHAWECAEAIPAWRSCAETTATRAASTAISSASRGATPSISPTIASAVTQPLVARWQDLSRLMEEAIDTVAHNFREIIASHGPQAIGVIGSNRTTNEENYLLQKFARLVLGTNNIDHHRTADFPVFRQALAENSAKRRDARCLPAPAILLVGNDPTNQHPLLAWQIRNNVRLHRAKLHVVNSRRSNLRQTGDHLRAGSGGKRRQASPNTLREMIPPRKPSRGLRPKRSPSCATHSGPSRIWSLFSAPNFVVTT
jgi:hypothetical protein